ncbi:MAG: amidohydrolase [Deltaproteobacteria bacterium]|nr:amidohydrolase [Deltaproteobacteria bacterium]MBI3387094.1 amidohydrolase [Deltaproteobacteria bacterium]
MSESIGIIDVWTQYLSPTPPEKRSAQAENVFKRYGKLDWYHNGTNVAQMLEDMDRSGVAIACISGEPHHVREAVRAHPTRFIGEYHADPTDIMAAVRGLQEHVEKYGFKVLRIEPFLWRKPPTDAAYYPLYAKCIELDVAFQTQVGNTGPLFPSETGRPTYIDQVALDFPELRIICGHIGWPWTEEMIAIAWKHANVVIDTSAHAPRHYPPAFVNFLKTFGQDKVCFATDYPLLGFDRVAKEIDEHLGLTPEVKRKFLRENARRILKLQ